MEGQAKDPLPSMNFVLYGIAGAAVMLGVVSMFILPSDVAEAPWGVVAVFVALEVLFVVGAIRYRVQLAPDKAPYLPQLTQRSVMTAAIVEFPVMLSFVVALVFLNHAMVTVATAATLILAVPSLRITDATISSIDRRLQSKGVMSGIRHELHLQ